MPRLLLDNITTVLQNREGRNGTSHLLRCNDASWVIGPGNDTTLAHVHGRVCGVGPSRVSWPFAVPWELEHRFTPGVWTASPLNGGGRKLNHNEEEDRD